MLQCFMYFQKNNNLHVERCRATPFFNNVTVKATARSGDWSQQSNRNTDPPHSETPPDGTNLNQECKLAADSGAFRPYTSMHRSHSFGSLLPAQAYYIH